jgi:hypothetical protein
VKAVKAVGIIVAAVVLFLLSVAGAQRRYPSKDIWSTVVSFDAAAGRMRTESCFLGLKISDTVEATPFTNVCRKQWGRLPPPEWSIDTRSTVSFGSINAVYKYHGAIATTNDMASMLKDRVFTDEARRKAVRASLGLLSSKGIWEAGDYEDAIAYMVHEREQSGSRTLIEATDLPSVSANKASVDRAD